MNVASIAMSVNLVNSIDKPMVAPTKSIRNTVNVNSSLETSTDEMEDDSLLPPPSNAPSPVDDGGNKEEDSSNNKQEDDNEYEDSEKVNGTGLVLYATPAATKTPYWKRRLGWKPNMTRVQRSKHTIQHGSYVPFTCKPRLYPFFPSPSKCKGVV